ncbi:hypothetical protein ACSSS7_002452 [Eimeria intestinalis]
MATTPVRCGGPDLEGEVNKPRSLGVYKDASGSNSLTKLGNSSSSTSRRPKSGAPRQPLQRSTSSSSTSISTSSSVNYNRSHSSSQCSKSSSSNSSSTENIKVVVRCRPISAAEQRSSSASAVHISAETQQVCVLLPATGIHRQQQQQQQRSSRVYRFDGVCPVSVQQEELFNTHVKPLLDQVLEGYNCTLFAYGQTGTGKTYTIEGPHDQYAEYLKTSSGSSTSSSSTKAASTSSSRSSSAAGHPAAADATASAGGSRVQTSCNKNTPNDSPRSNTSSSNIRLSPDAGILPRAVNYIFQQLQQSSSSSSTDYMVRCSFLEIYNEELVDMLAPPSTAAAAPASASSQQQQQQPKLRIYEEQQVDSTGNGGSSSSWGATKGHGAVRVEGLTEKRVNCPQEVFSLLLGAAPRRSFACSGSNARSSRSHTIFSLSVCITESPKLAVTAGPSEGGSEETSSSENTPPQQPHATEALAVEEVVRIGKLNLVDLAGSENLEKSWGGGADSARRKEASAINQSLLTLGRCINALVEKNTYIPFRDSKLTRLLQDSLGGSTKTCLIATIGPTADTLEETLCTLDYAFRAKSVTTRPVATLRRSRDALLSQLMSENTQLRLLLQLQREREGVFLPLDTYSQQQQQHQQQQRMLQQQGLLVQQQHQQLEEQQQQMQLQQEKAKQHVMQIEALQVALQLCQRNLADEQMLVKSLEKQQQQHADAAAAAADSLKRAVADIQLLEQQQTQQRQQQQAAADACAAFAKTVEAQASAGAAEQQQLLQQVQKLLQALQDTEEQRAKAAADSAAAAVGHQQQHQLLQQHLQRHCELLVELQERQTHQRQVLLQQLQQVRQEAELTEAAAQEQKMKHAALLEHLMEAVRQQQQKSTSAAEQVVEAARRDCDEKHQRLRQSLQFLIFSVAAGGDAAAQQLQQVHQQLQADAAARQQQTEAAAAAVVAAVQQQLATFVEAQRVAAQQQQQLIKEQLACAQRQHQEQQAGHAAAGETANQSALAATAAADALTTRAIDVVQQVSAAAAATAAQHHKQLSAAKEDETAETLTRLKSLRCFAKNTLFASVESNGASCLGSKTRAANALLVRELSDVFLLQQQTSSEQEALLQHAEVLLKQHREAEATAHSAAADAGTAAARQAQQHDNFAAAAAAALEAAATGMNLCRTCCEKQAAVATEHAATLARDTRHQVSENNILQHRAPSQVRRPCAQHWIVLRLSVLPRLQLRKCLEGSQEGGDALEESSVGRKSDLANSCSESSGCGNCASCTAEQAARRWQAWRSLELPPLLTTSALRFATAIAVAVAARQARASVGAAARGVLVCVGRCREASRTRGEQADTHPLLTPDRSPSCSGSTVAAGTSQHSSKSNSRKAVGSRLVAAAAACVTAAATPLQTQGLGRQKSLVGAPVGPSPSKGGLDGNSKQQQSRQETTAIADGRVRRRSRSGDERNSADSANKKRHTPTDEGKESHPKTAVLLNAVLTHSDLHRGMI